MKHENGECRYTSIVVLLFDLQEYMMQV